MSRYKKLSDVIYHHTFHLVWTPKYRYRILEGQIKGLLEDDIRGLCEWKGAEVLELRIQPDHVHLVVSIPPKVSVSTLMGVLKGKTAIKIFKSYPQLKKKPYWGNHFWARGYCSSTIGLDEEMVRKYVKYQEDEEKKAERQQEEFSLF
jgi:putative transposase